MQSCLVRRILCGIAVAAGISDAQSIVDLKGKAVDPLRQVHPKPSVLIFLRTDCPISNRYAPVIQDLSAKYSGRASFWLVYPGRTQRVEDIQKQLRDYRYSVPSLRDTQHQLAGQSQVTVTPEAAVFDKRGKLVYHGRIDNWYQDFGRARSAATSHELEDAVLATLRGEAPKVGATRAIGCSIADLE